MKFNRKLRKKRLKPKINAPDFRLEPFLCITFISNTQTFYYYHDKLGNRIRRIPETMPLRQFRLTEGNDLNYEKINEDVAVSIGPNPTADIPYIEFKSNMELSGRIKLISSSGRLIKNIFISQSVELNMVSLPAGSYILTISGDNYNYSKIIIKN